MDWLASALGASGLHPHRVSTWVDDDRVAIGDLWDMNTTLTADINGNLLGATTAGNSVTSKVEEEVCTFLRESGYQVPETKLAIWCRHPQRLARFLALTPDIALVEHKLAIEVDPCAPISSGSRGATHLGAEEEDLLRNDLMVEAGWTVVRLRLGGLQGSQIGDRDVVCESSSLTAAGKSALLETLREFIDNAPAKVRFVPKADRSKAKKPTRHASVLRINEFQYADDGHIFSWYPSLDSERKRYMRLAMNGRFLYDYEKESSFVCEVGLHKLPRKEWAAHLTLVLAQLSPTVRGSGKFPWGESLFVAVGDEGAATQIITDAGYKGTIDVSSYGFSTWADGVSSSDGIQILDAQERTIVRLHEQAVELGYFIESLVACDSRRGPYSRVEISRCEK